MVVMMVIVPRCVVRVWAAEVLRASSLAKSCFVFLLQNWNDIKREHPEVVTHLDDAVKRKIEDHLRRTFRLGKDGP
jgi:hypothetical protein